MLQERLVYKQKRMSPFTFISPARTAIAMPMVELYFPSVSTKKLSR
ncbi:hypothetical protein SAMN05444162_1081 [Paenibacillaceae bacterium GAS479]|nr:hypothetical protein SAMN05444162_1081 [Paenibacillaceae bacterium GAS479]